MNKKIKFKDIEKIDIIGILLLVVLALLYVDLFDVNERFKFPINVIDEPLLILTGIILGYLIAKFRFKRTIKKLLA